jgi:hypothetical protein
MPAARLKFATFTTRDVVVTRLRETFGQIMRSARAALKAVRNAQYALMGEFSVEGWGEHYHPHAHVIVNTPPSGRSYVSLDGWTNAWLTELPSHLHPIEGGAHVELVRDLGASCAYLTKSAFGEADSDKVERIMEGITAIKGLQKFNCRGDFKAVPS